MNISILSAPRIPYRIIVLLLICFLIPLIRIPVPPLIILYALLRIPGLKTKNYKELLVNKFFLIPAGFYFLHIFGLLYTENMNEGLFDLEVKMSLLVLPFLILSDKEVISIHVEKIFLVFLSANLVASFWCLIFGLYKTIKFSDTNYLTYQDFSLFHNPTYSSLYLVFSMGIIFWFNIKNNFFELGKWFYVSLLSLFFLSWVIYLNSSKSGLCSALLVTVYFLYVFFRRPDRKKSLTIPFILLLVIAAFFLVRNPRVLGTSPTTGFAHFLKTPIRSMDVNNCESWTVRFVMFIQAYELIKENPVTGVGTGDVMKSLMNKYESKNLLCLKGKRINAHNQFLETFIGIGIIGFTVLLMLIFYPLYYSFKQQDILLIFFSIVIITGFLFESMLNRQAGVVFYSLFYSLLMAYRKEKI